MSVVVKTVNGNVSIFNVKEYVLKGENQNGTALERLVVFTTSGKKYVFNYRHVVYFEVDE